MGQHNDDGRGAPHSLAPIQLDTWNDARELSRMRGGNGLRVLLLLIAGTAATYGGAQLLTTMNSRQGYASAAAQLQRSDTEGRDAFMRCALPSYQRSQLALPNALRAEVLHAMERFGANYGKVLGSCSVMLAAFEQATRDVKAPADMRPRVEAVVGAATELGDAWQELEHFLVQSGAAYDRARANVLIEKIDLAWQGYQRAGERAKQALSARL